MYCTPGRPACASVYTGRLEVERPHPRGKGGDVGSPVAEAAGERQPAAPVVERRAATRPPAIGDLDVAAGRVRVHLQQS